MHDQKNVRQVCGVHKKIKSLQLGHGTCINNLLDIIGSMEESGNKKLKIFLVVVDYCTKWIEAKPFQTIYANQVKNFLWHEIVCRHGLPYKIVTDNGKNLTWNKVRGIYLDNRHFAHQR
ncbi:hypothetical protein V5N11_003686 [Cardamine amara subsp. amara]|uniref:Pol polyprotein n=1 Tax=Cardamine amara subsp. amara TaxID=228776 RepID=A0ABD0ZTL7_CARAN